MKTYSLFSFKSLVAFLMVLCLLPVAYAGNAGACSDVFSGKQSSYSQSQATVAPKSRGYNPITYYADKMREIKELDASAPFAMVLRGLIMTRTSHVTKEFVSLKLLKPIHPIDRGAALEKLAKRTQAIKQLPEAKTGEVRLDERTLNTVMPSKNSMRAIRADNGDVVVFDGNGRLVAIQNAFIGQSQNVFVEVEMFHANSKLLQMVLSKVRNMRNVLEE